MYQQKETTLTLTTMTTSTKYNEICEMYLNNETIKMNLDSLVETFNSTMYDLWLSGEDSLEDSEMHREFFVNVLRPRIMRNKKQLLENSELHNLVCLAGMYK